MAKKDILRNEMLLHKGDKAHTNLMAISIMVCLFSLIGSFISFLVGNGFGLILLLICFVFGFFIYELATIQKYMVW